MTLSIVEPYNQALRDIILFGQKTDTTLALYNYSLTFNLRKMNDYIKSDYSLFLPYKRGKLTTSAKYGIAEAIWYRKLTNEIDLIVPFGKIWEKMTDENGFINSNYGYQLTKNQNVNDKIKELEDVISGDAVYKKVDFYIASVDNQHSMSDLVCNNKIELILQKTVDDQIELSARIVARSIDVIFGLPYDMFAAQGFMTYVAHQLNETMHYHNIVTLAELTFDIINMHWYLNLDPSEEQLAELSGEVVVVKDAYYLPFNMTTEEINNIKTVEQIKEYRDKVDSEKTSIQTIYDDLIVNESQIDGISFTREELINYLSIFDSYKEIKDRVERIFELLDANKHERKVLIMQSDNTLRYIRKTTGNLYVLYTELG